VPESKKLKIVDYPAGVESHNYCSYFENTELKWVFNVVTYLRTYKSLYPLAYQIRSYSEQNKPASSKLAQSDRGHFDAISSLDLHDRNKT